MRRHLLILAAALAGLAACQRSTPQGAAAVAERMDRQPSQAQVSVTASPAQVPAAADFVAKAAAGDAFEIAAAQLALQRSQNAKVRDFAQMMIRDHTLSSQGLKNAVQESGQDLPSGGGMDPEQQKALADLKSTGPAAFDQAYADGQVDAHQEALQLLQTYAGEGEVTSLKAFAATAAAVVQSHYEAATKLAAQLR